MPEKSVTHPTQNKTGEPKRKKFEEESVKTGKINKYGFLHVNKALARHLNIQDQLGKNGEDVPVSIEPIENGFVVEVIPG